MHPLFEKKLITTKDAGELSGYSSDYLSRLVRSGKIAGEKVGHTWLVDKESLTQFLGTQGDRKIDRARELASERAREYRAHRSLLHRATKTLTTSVDVPEQFINAGSSFLSHAVALSVASAVVVVSALAAQAPVIPQIANAVASVAHETATGFDAAFGDIPGNIIAHITAADTAMRSASPRLQRSSAIESAKITSSLFVAKLSEPDLAPLRMMIGEEANPNTRTIAGMMPEVNASTITIGDVQVAALNTISFITSPAQITHALASAYTALGTNAYAAIGASFAAYDSLIAHAGSSTLTLAASARDTLRTAPSAISHMNLALGESIIAASHSVIRADVAVSYWTAAAAPATARRAVAIIGSTGDALARATAQVPSLATTAYLRATEAPATLAPALAEAIFSAEYAGAKRFVGATNAVSQKYLALIKDTGDVAYTVAVSSRRAPSALHDAYLGALGKSALALERASRIQPIAAAIAAVTPALSVSEQVALATYETIHSVFSSFGDTLAMLFAPSPIAVAPNVTLNTPLVIVSTSSSQTTLGTARGTPQTVNSFPTYTTIVQGVSPNLLSQSLASMRADILGTVSSMIQPVSSQVAQNGTTIQYVNMIQDLSNLIVRNGDFRGGTFTNASGISATNGTFTNLTTTGDLTVSGTATSTFAGNLSVAGNINLNGAILQNNAPLLSSQWTTSGSTIYYTAGNIGIGTTSPYSLLSISNNLNTSANTPLFTIASTTGGTATSTLMTILASGRVGIGTSLPDASAILDLTSTTGGLLVPRLTTAQKTTIVAPVAGLTLYDSTLNKLNVYNGSAWKNVGSTEIGGEVTNGTQGSVLFIGDGAVLGQDSANFNYSTSTGRLGIGTTTPFATLSLAGTAGGTTSLFALSTSTAAFATSTALIVDKNGNLSLLGGSTLSVGNTSQTNIAGDGATSTVYGPLLVRGTPTQASSFTLQRGLNNTDNSIIFNDQTGSPLLKIYTAANTGYSYVNGQQSYLSLGMSVGGEVLRIDTSNNARFTGNVIPSANQTYNLGTPAVYWNNGYVNNIVANNLSSASTSIAGTNNTSFSINSNNPTTDTQDMSLIFYRGAGASTNAVISWNSTLKRFEFNQNLYVANDPASTGSTTLRVAAVAGQTGALTNWLDSSGNVLSTVLANGSIGVGTSSPSQALSVTGKIYTATGVQFSDGSLQTSAAGTAGSGLQGQIAFYNANGTTISATSSINILQSGNVLLGTIGTTAGNLALAAGSSAQSRSWRFLNNDAVQGDFAIQQSTTQLGSTFATKFTIDPNGNVGIGTQLPGRKLEIMNTAGSSQNLTLSNSDFVTGVGTSLQFYTGATTGNTYYGIQAWNNGELAKGNLILQAGGGNVGIGTTTPFAVLNIATTTGRQLVLTDSSAGTNLKHWMFSSQGGNLYVGTTTDLYATTTQPALTITNSGSVGIGTSSPAATFSVVGTEYLKTTTNSSNAFVVENASATTTFSISTVDNSSNILSIASSTGASYFEITSAGFIGIGTASPVNALDINSSEGIHLLEGVPASTGMALYNNAGALTWNGIALATGSSTISGTTNYVPLYTGSTALGNSVIAQSSGNVGIGTTTPWGLLSVNPSGITGPAFVIGSSTATNFIVTNAGSVGIGTTTPWGLLSVNPSGITGPAFVIGSSTATNFIVTNGGNVGIGGITNPTSRLQVGTSTNDSATATITIAGASYLQLGGREYNDNSYRLLTLGYKRETSTYSPAYIGYQEISNIGVTLGDLIFGTRSVTTDTEPSERLRITNTGNVGIGTTTPWGQLSASSTSAFPTLAINQHGAGAAAIFLGGNVGIGTTTPGSLFSIQGIANFTTATSTFYGTGINLASGCFAVGGVCVGSGSGGVGSGTQGQLAFYNAAGTNLTATSSLFLSQTGNFGIGTTTPWGLLSVNPTASLGSAPQFVIGSSTATNFIVTNAGSVGIGTTSPMATLAVTGTSRFKSTTGSTDAFVIEDSNGATAFQVSTVLDNSNILTIASSSGASYLEVTSAGNVGIGTANPSSKLEVNGDIQITAASGGRLIFQDGSSMSSSVSSGGGVGVTSWGDLTYTTGGAINFQTGTGLATTTKMVVTNAGLVGIGTAAPGTTLEVNGTIDAKTAANTGTYQLGGVSVLSASSAALLSINGGGFTSVNISGNVGIGTTSPYAALSVVGASGVVADHYAATSTTATSTIAGFLDVNGTGTNATSTFASNLWVKGTLQVGTGSIFITDNGIRSRDGTINLSTGTATSTFTNGLAVGTSQFVVQSATGRIGIGTTTPASILDIYGTDAIHLPVGTTAQRPGMALTGQVRYNSQTHQFEGYGDNAVWQGLGGVVNAGQTSYITAGTDDYLRFFTASAERMTFSNTGMLGIGTTTPFASLQIATTTGKQLVLTDLGAGTNLKHWMFSSMGGNLFIGTTTDVYATSTPPAFTIANSGSVGIGTVSPVNTLDVNTGGGIHITSGTPTATSMALYNNAGTLTWNGVALATGASLSGTTNYLPVFTGANSLGNSVMAQSGNNVGIGTTTPFATLQIATTTGKQLVLSDLGAGTNLKHWLFSSQGGSLYIGTTTDAYATSTPSAITITNTGRIGVGSTSPMTALTVTGSATVTGDIGVGMAAVGSGGQQNRVELGSPTDTTTFFGQTNASAGGIVAGAYINSSNQYVYANHSGTQGVGRLYLNNGTLSFDNAVAGTLGNVITLLPQFKIDTNGNVGIGTTSPYARLAVAGTVVADSFTATSTTATSTFAGFIDVNGTGTNATSTFASNLWVKGTLRAAVSYVGDLVFSNGFRFVEGDANISPQTLNFNNQMGSTTLTITDAGNIGIGTTTPNHTLSVAGDIGAIAFVNTSTRSAKTDITYATASSTEDMLNQLVNLRVASYRYTIEAQNDPLHIGLIAEDTQITAPEVLSADGKGVDIYKLATFTLAGVQALAARMDSQNMRIASLEDRVAKIESGAVSVASGSPITLSTTSLASALSAVGVLIDKGIAQFNTLVFRQLVASKDADGTSSAGSVTIVTGSALAQVTNSLVKPSTKVFVTFNSSVTGSWWVSDKVAGSFRVVLSAPQVADVSFDYFLVQTEGQMAMSTPSAPAASGSDHTAPVVTLIGDNPLHLSIGGTFVEPGVSVVDDVDGTGGAVVAYVDGILQTDATAIDTSTQTTHIITYLATDNSGNTSDAVNRSVIIGSPSGSGTTATSTPASSDTTAPVVTLIGGAAPQFTVGDTFTDPGATALDDTDGDLTASVNITGLVDTATAGSYPLTYSATDVAGNTGSASRLVTVVASSTPAI